MNTGGLVGWENLRHGGLLLDAQRQARVAELQPDPLPFYMEKELRRIAGGVLEGNGDVPEFVSFVMTRICGFTEDTGSWWRGSNVSADWGRKAITGERVRPRQLWRGHGGGILPVFIDREKRIGIGRGRKATSQVLQWLRAGDERLALLTNGKQWRLIFAGLDFDAWCEWDLDLWLEEGQLSPQVTALRTLFMPDQWIPLEAKEPSPLLQAILDSRKGQAELSAVLGERVRESVEMLLQGHGEVLKEACADIDPAEIYRAAVRMVMRMAVILFAESRDLLPRDNALYHGSYGLTGLLEELEKVATRGDNRLVRSWNAWPRVLALFRLVYQGSHHPDLPVPAYGGELFAPGDPESDDAMARVIAVFESACYERELFPDRMVYRILERITRTRMKVRQGWSSTWITAPMDFSDLSSEYIGILYEGLLDFELKTAPEGDPVIFLAVGNQPALPLSRLESMDDKALANLFDKLKDTSSSEDEEEEAEEELETEETEIEEEEGEEEKDLDEPEEEEEGEDARHVTRTRAETWARHAVEVAKLVRKPRGRMTPEKKLKFEEAIAAKARQLVSRVVLPGEWYLVRWGGTRKGAGTFYTRPGLAVPTTQRTLRPLAYDPPLGKDGKPNREAPPVDWTPKKPEVILELKVCDPACGSGSFPVAALRFLTEALYQSLHHHGRIEKQGQNSLVALLYGQEDESGLLSEELLPCRPEDDIFEPRLKAVLRRHVVERCIYGVDLDPLAVELCRLALWVETMDRNLPFSFLDHKIKCGNSLVGAWFDQFQHYPVMAWKNREGGDKNHNNGVHFKKGERTKAIKAFVRETLTPDIRHAIEGRTLFDTEEFYKDAHETHKVALETLTHLHEMPVQNSADRASLYQVELLCSDAYQLLKMAMDLWCTCWFWPVMQLEHAPIPSEFQEPTAETLRIASQVSSEKRFFHWELEFPDVFNHENSGFDAILSNPPWETLQPNSKEFFSNIDPLYRSYGKQEALRYQTSYFSKVDLEREWLKYSGGFANDSNWMKFAALPFGDPTLTDNSVQRFMIARGKDNSFLHTQWRKIRERSHGFATSKHPYRYRGQGKAYTYKLFLEQGYTLLKNGGLMGIIVPSGIYSDLGTVVLRELFLEQCSWEWLFGFDNREGIFDIHRSYKFNPLIVKKGSRTSSIRTAFMQGKLEKWENAESIAAHYRYEQIEQFSPRSKVILEIQSSRDLQILEKVYENSILLGDDSTEGWRVRFAQGDFNMTSDSKLFPPRPKWEEDGYIPDEYSRWLKGKWSPIDDLWSDLGIKPQIAEEMPDTQFSYDLLPITRNEIPTGVTLSRNGKYWIERASSQEALPVYNAKMFNLFDFSSGGWIRGKGRGAVWNQIDFPKYLSPEYLMKREVFLEETAESPPWYARLLFKDISTSTHQRTILSTIVPRLPTVNASPYLSTITPQDILFLQCQLGSFIVDFVARLRIGYLHLNYFVIEELPLLRADKISGYLRFKLSQMGVSLTAVHEQFSPIWLIRQGKTGQQAWRQLWAATAHARLRLRCIIDAIIAILFGLDFDDLKYILRECSYPVDMIIDRSRSNDMFPKGFWRVDKAKDPELRHTILTLVTFHDLQAKIEASGGDREKGIQAFLDQNDGEGWMLPETLRLADYDLGHDGRAKEHQPVASRLGPRFYDWQLAQDPEESWRECHLHARNLLGEEGYKQLLEEIEAEKRGESLNLSDESENNPIDGNEVQPRLL